MLQKRHIGLRWRLIALVLLILLPMMLLQAADIYSRLQDREAEVLAANRGANGAGQSRPRR